MVPRNSCSPSLVTVLLLLIPGAVCAFDERLDSVMYQDPAVIVPEPATGFSDRLIPLWTSALQRPEGELRRVVSDTITVAHSYGVPNMVDMADELIAVLKSDAQAPTVRRAAANALVSLDVQRAAAILHDQATGPGLDIAELVEPALARWDYQPMRDVWLARLNNPQQQRVLLQLAIHALGLVEELKAKPRLMALVADPQLAPDLRLAAARAVARIDSQGLAEPADRLAASSKLLDRLLAATLLERHSTGRAVEVLKSLARDESAAVAGAAQRRLFDLDPNHTYALANATISRPDVNLRRIAAQSLVAVPSPDAMSRLGPRLNDPNPTLRQHVAKSYIELAQREGLRSSIVTASAKMLASDEWAGLHESAIVLGTLDDEAAGHRLLQLLTHRRPEVKAASSWALRKLAVSETFPEMQAFGQQQFDDIVADRAEQVFAVDFQLGQVFQAFGENRYAPADKLLQNFVPKTYLQYGEARPGAVWALGYLHEDKAPQDLTAALVGRLSDTNPLTPEPEHFRRICAVTLGRMNSVDALPVLRRFADEEEGSQVGMACDWAIERMTGEPPRPVKSGTMIYNHWFLAPR